MYKTLQAYIRFLEQHGELVRIAPFVDPVLEIAEIADRVAKSPGGGKALLFEDTGTAFPVLINMFGSRLRMLHALGQPSYEQITQRINRLFTEVTSPKQSLWDKLKLLPTLKQASQWMPKISNGRGACQEVVHRTPDLSILPVLKCWPHDGGRFVTLPMVQTKDPLTGNVGMYRMQVFSATTAGMHWHQHKTGARHFRTFKEQHPAGGRFPVAVALGGDPVYTYGAVAPMPENIDEYLLAGFLRNKRVNLVRCITQPQLEVPADADIVIEGYIDANALPVTEGPFGDHTGFYSLEDFYPMMQVTCITHRKQAVYPATIVGIPPQEDACLAEATERLFLAPIRLALAPEVVDLHLPAEGVAHNLAIVKIKKSYPGQALKVAHTLWGAGQMMFTKIIVVVDGEVDITDYNNLVQHLAACYRPARDTYFGSGPLDVLDHAAAEPAFGGKLCIDATQKDLTEALSSPLYSFIHYGDTLPEARIVVQFDKHVDIHDIATCVWLLGNNIDAVRDVRIANNQLIIDATTKPGQVAPRRWPNIVCSNNDTINTIDAKWPFLGLGEPIASPSLKYNYLRQPGEAAVKLDSSNAR